MYYAEKSSVLPNDIGMQAFNISIENPFDSSGSTLGFSYGQFLSDPSNAVKLESGNDPWRRNIFMPTGLSAVRTGVIDANPTSDLLVVHDSKGYLLEFEPVFSTFEFATEECRVLGISIAAVQICLANRNGSIAASKSIHHTPLLGCAQSANIAKHSTSATV